MFFACRNFTVMIRVSCLGRLVGFPPAGSGRLVFGSWHTMTIVKVVVPQINTISVSGLVCPTVRFSAQFVPWCRSCIKQGIASLAMCLHELIIHDKASIVKGRRHVQVVPDLDFLSVRRQHWTHVMPPTAKQWDTQIDGQLSLQLQRFFSPSAVAIKGPKWPSDCLRIQNESLPQGCVGSYANFMLLEL